MTNYALMLDIETLGLRPDSAVTQVGGCVINLDGRFIDEKWNFNHLIEVNPEKQHIDWGTLCWWMRQDRKVAEGVFKEDGRIPAIDLFYALKIIVDAHPDITVWGSPAMFDLPILTSLWNGEKPWLYNYERDLMTLYKTFDPLGKLKPAENGMAHDALADALWQGKYLLNLNEEISRLGYHIA